MIKIYVANLGKYNEGILLGEWITLPCTKVEWQNLLIRIKLGRYNEDGDFENYYEEDGVIYEEWAIHDYESDFGIEIGEYSNIRDLNFLAAALEECDEPSLVIEWLNQTYTGYSYEEAINATMQRDDISFYPYDFIGINDCAYMSPEEKLGYTIAELSGVYDYLNERNLECYFDFKKYAEDYIIDGQLILLEDGYIDNLDSEPDLTYYSEEEIADEFYEYDICA